MLNSKEIVDKNIKITEKKVKTNFFKILMLGLLAGLYISLGVAAKNAVVYKIANDSVAKMIKAKATNQGGE